MKKVTLCAFGARYTHSNMALHCLKKAVPFDIRILDFSIKDRLEYAIEKIVSDEPDVVGFSCYIWSIDTVLRAAPSIKKILPGCFILLGGPEVSFGSEEFITKHSFIDMIIKGEGEPAFAKFMESLNGKGSILETPSACIRNGSEIVTTKDAPPAVLDELGFIYDDFASFENKMIYYETSRGCPYRCAYCMSAEQSTRFLSIERVRKEFEVFLKAGVKRVKLVDRTFNYPAERAYDIFSLLIELSEKYPDSGTNFHFEVSACLLTEKILSLLNTAKPGLIQLEIGVQSTNEKTLKAINRSHDTKKLLDNTKRLCSMDNIHVHTDLIAGLPLEDYESFAKSFDNVYSLGAEHLQLGFLKVLRGSPMHDMAEEYGIEYADYPPYEVLKTGVLSYSQLRQLKDIAEMVEQLHNSGRFKKTLGMITGSSPFSFFESMAVYAKSEGFFEQPQPKQRLSELVYSYCGKDKKTGEALLYDWFIAEKSAKLPDGLVLILPNKEAQRAYFEDADNLAHYAHLSPGERSSRCKICIFETLFGEKTVVLFDYHELKKTTAVKIEL